jgi:hypothetical protein
VGYQQAPKLQSVFAYLWSLSPFSLVYSGSSGHGASGQLMLIKESHTSLTLEHRIKGRAENTDMSWTASGL